WGGKVELKDVGVKTPVSMPTYKVGDPIEVKQVLTWQTAPVKRIDQVALGYNSSRTADKESKRHPRAPKAPEQPQTPQPTDTPPGGTPPPGTNPGDRPTPGGPPGGGSTG